MVEIFGITKNHNFGKKTYFETISVKFEFSHRIESFNIKSNSRPFVNICNRQIQIFLFSSFKIQHFAAIFHFGNFFNQPLKIYIFKSKKNAEFLVKNQNFAQGQIFFVKNRSFALKSKLRLEIETLLKNHILGNN